MIHDDIYILASYDSMSTFGDVIKVSPNEFITAYESQKYPKFVMIPVVEDPSGIIQYVKVNANRLVYRFKECKIKYRLRVEYFYDEETDPIILPEVELVIHDVIELYQALWNITRFTSLYQIMNDMKNKSAPGSEVMLDQILRIIDIASYHIEIKDSNKGSLQYDFGYHDRNSNGRYIFSEVLSRELGEIMHSVEDDYDSFSLNGPIFIDDDFEEWAISEAYGEVQAIGEYFYPIASGAYVLSSAIDFKYLSKSVYYKGYSSNVYIIIIVINKNERTYALNMDDMIGKYYSDRAILDKFEINKIDLSLLMEFLTDTHFIAECLALFEMSLNDSLKLDDIMIRFIVGGELSYGHNILVQLDTDDDFPNESAFIHYLDAIERALS